MSNINPKVQIKISININYHNLKKWEALTAHLLKLKRNMELKVSITLSENAPKESSTNEPETNFKELTIMSTFKKVKILNGSISKEGNSSQPWKKLPQMLKLIKRVSSKKTKANIRKLSVNFLATTKNSKGLMNLKRKSENNTKFKEKKFRLKLIRKSRKQLQLEV